MKPNESTKIAITTLPEKIPNSKIIWTSKDSNIASVNQDGTVIATNIGETDICACFEGYSDEFLCHIIVKGENTNSTENISTENENQSDNNVQNGDDSSSISDTDNDDNISYEMELQNAKESQSIDNSVERMPSLSVGSVITDASGADTGYIVTNSVPENLTVEYAGTQQDKNQKNITIPKTITDANGNVYTVTSIKSGAFKGNKKLKKVVIPNTVTEIGSSAFKGCKNLKKIKIYANPDLKIGSGAFKKISKDAVIKVKGVKGKQKEIIKKAIKKQTNAKVK